MNENKKRGNDGRVAVMVDKGLFIKGIVDEGLAAGVKAYFNTNVIDVWNDPKAWWLPTARATIIRASLSSLLTG